MNTKYFVCAIMLFVVSGCTSLPKDYGRSEVDTLLTDRNITIDALDTIDVEDYVTSLIKQPLTVTRSHNWH